MKTRSKSRVPRNEDERRASLTARRREKMARSAHAFVRGSTERFYEWLDRNAAVALPSGPDVWICGDCHTGNMGPIARCEGAAVVELRDLDQAVVGNPAFDLTRLALSLAMTARSSDLPGVATARMTEDLIAGYESAFDGERPREDVDGLPRPIRVVMKRAIQRTCRDLLEERLGRQQPRFPIGKKFWPLTEDEHAAVAELIRSEEIRRLITKLQHRDDDARVRLLDAAYWVKGCSSLGLWRAAALVEVAGGDGADGALSLVDIKEALLPRVPVSADARLPRNQAERVVRGARALAPALGERMGAATVLDRDVFVRELLPQDLKVELDVLSPKHGRSVAHYLGLVVGRAHSRQLDEDARRRWMAALASQRTKNIDAPSWLWQAVVDLVADHERAYLEHCRRFALETMPKQD